MHCQNKRITIKQQTTMANRLGIISVTDAKKEMKKKLHKSNLTNNVTDFDFSESLDAFFEKDGYNLSSNFKENWGKFITFTAIKFAYKA